MLLETMTCPADLAALDAERARGRWPRRSAQFVVDAVNAHGGHLGSNLGVVELTLALHRVFDSPDDPILWDTGHQAYVHKIVTGRAAGFSARCARPAGCRATPAATSPTTTGSRTATPRPSCPTPTGWPPRARPRPARHDRRVVAVIGDGSHDRRAWPSRASTTWATPAAGCVIILNDNGRSYAPTVSKLSESLIKLRLDPRSTAPARTGSRQAWCATCRRRRAASSGAGTPPRPPSGRCGSPARSSRTLGVRYAGPVDGHDIAELEQALRQRRPYDDGPVVLHVLTEKGRGYAPAENDPIKKLHDMSEFKPGSYTAAFSEALVKEGEAPARAGGHHRRHARLHRPAALRRALPRPLLRRRHRRAARRHLRRRHGHGRPAPGGRGVLDVPHPGLRPGQPRRRPARPARWCSASTGPASPATTAPSHHGVLDLVLLTKVPGMTVFAPVVLPGAAGRCCTTRSSSTDGPAAIRFPKTAARRRGRGRGRASACTAAACARAPSVCLLGVGKMVGAALEAAADLLAADGVDGHGVGRPGGQAARPRR